MELPQGSPPRIPQELLPSPRNSPEVPGPPQGYQGRLPRVPRSSPKIAGAPQEFPFPPLSNEGAKQN